MHGLKRQRRGRRLLTCTFGALAVSAAFAGTARAGLDDLTGQKDPIAATVGGVTAAAGQVTTTVSEATEPPMSTNPTGGDPVATTVSTASGVVSDTTKAVSNSTQAATQAVSPSADAATQTVTSTVQRVTKTVSGTTQALTSTAEQTLTATEGTLGGVTSGPSTVGQRAQLVAPATPTASMGTPPAPRPPVGADPASAGSEPSRFASTFTRVESAEASTSVPQRTLVVPAHSRSAGRDVVQANAPALLSTKPNGAGDARVSVPRAPRAPLPGLPSSITALLGGSSTGGSFALAALLGVLLLMAFGAAGTRLRPGAAIFRPPDVFSSLERPG